MKEKNLKLSGLMLASVIIIVSFVYAVNIQPVVIGKNPYRISPYVEVQTFQTYDKFVDFLKNNCYIYRCNNYHCRDSNGQIVPSAMSLGSASGLSKDSEEVSSVGYSETNIQVQGVDEPDIVKTDGKYVYLVSNSKVYIIKAYPAVDAKILSVISLDIGIDNIFINGDQLIIFRGNWGTSTTIKIYDISDRKNPEIFKEIEFDGSYFDSRMIGEYIYIIATEYTGDILYMNDENVTINMPKVTINGETSELQFDDIYYVNNSDTIDTMTHVISINIKNGEVNQKSFLLGYSQEMYVSKDNIFLTTTNYSYLEYPTITGGLQYRNVEDTIIHKISIKNGEITYVAQGSVPGHVLNQFSMDEHDGFFRIATTVGEVWDHEYKSSNNIYILNESLDRVSEIEGLAPGEKIYSARFMGNRAYLVTFKKVDPFFTIDLSDPHNPKVLGELKIPGYSDYLHPYDENHVIGIGKDTVEALDELKESRGIDFAWYQGIKIALFDVSDFENPKEVAKVVIGDRGTDSPALYDHKAFLFDREKELLVIPISLCKIDEEIKEQNNGYTGNIYGKYTFQGTYVYKLNLDGFELLGRITHRNESEPVNNQYRWYWGSSNYDITRSLFIGNILYTISNSMVKMNDLKDLSEINSIELD